MSAAGRVRGARATALTALAVTAGLLSPAWATPVRHTNTLTAQYRLRTFDDGPNGEEEIGYGLLLDRLNVVGSADNITATARIDAMMFLNRPNDDFRDDVRAERLNMNFRIGDGELQFGDFYRQLGRGILLSLRKQDEVGVDVAVRGAQAGYTGETHRVALFGGWTNTSNIDSVTEQFVADPDDHLVGAEYGLRGLGPLQLGVHGLYLGVRDDLLPRDATDDGVLGVGGSVEVPDLIDIGSVYVEADWQQRRLVGNTEDGLAAYALAELFFGDLGLTLEGLYLDNWVIKGSPNSALSSPFVYNQPPTLERIDQEVVNSENVTGGRVRVDYNLLDGDLQVYANGMYRIADPGVAAEVTALHGFAGFELYYDDGGSRLGISGGWRDESQTNGGPLGDLKSMTHAELDWLQQLGSGWAVEVSSLNEFRTLRGDDYRRGSTLVSLGRSSLGALTVEYGFDTQDQSEGARNHFLAGIIDWYVVEHGEVFDSLKIRAVGGTQRGGLKCIGGVCRIFPEFAGGRVDVQGTFDL